MKRVILLVIVALGFVSCFKETAFETNLIIKPVLQTESGGEYTPLEGVVAYAFDGGIDGWEIRSIDDALSGVATSVEGAEQRGAIAMSDPLSGSFADLTMLVEQEEIFIVVADPVSQIYGYSDYIIPINLEKMYLTVSFLGWKDGSYTSGTWTYIAPEKEPEVDEPLE